MEFIILFLLWGGGILTAFVLMFVASRRETRFSTLPIKHSLLHRLVSLGAALERHDLGAHRQIVCVLRQAEFRELERGRRLRSPPVIAFPAVMHLEWSGRLALPAQKRKELFKRPLAEILAGGLAPYNSEEAPSLSLSNRSEIKRLWCAIAPTTWASRSS